MVRNVETAGEACRGMSETSSCGLYVNLRMSLGPGVTKRTNELRLPPSRNLRVSRNPYDLERTVGGSSGGSGCATAANFSTVAIGEETLASIRRPGGWNGVAR